MTHSRKVHHLQSTANKPQIHSGHQQRQDEHERQRHAIDPRHGLERPQRRPTEGLRGRRWTGARGSMRALGRKRRRGGRGLSLPSLFCAQRGEGHLERLGRATVVGVRGNDRSPKFRDPLTPDRFRLSHALKRAARPDLGQYPCLSLDRPSGQPRSPVSTS